MSWPGTGVLWRQELYNFLGKKYDLLHHKACSKDVSQLDFNLAIDTNIKAAVA